MPSALRQELARSAVECREGFWGGGCVSVSSRSGVESHFSLEGIFKSDAFKGPQDHLINC